MKRKIITLEDSQRVLTPHYQGLLEDIVGGFADYLKIKNYIDTFGRFTQYESRTNAGIIHEHIKARVSERFGSTALTDGEAKKWNGIFGLRINDDVIIRFKKLDDDKRVAGLQTKQHVKYMQQALIDGFPDEPTFLIAGYVPSATWTEIKGIYIGCWNGRIIEWFDEIGKYTTQQLSLFDHSGLSIMDNRSLVQRKGQSNDQSQIEESNTRTGTNDK